MSERWDVVIVGGGPAGLAAATWLARYRRRTLLIDAGHHRNERVSHTHGYLTRDGAAPGELLESAGADLDDYAHVERRAGTVDAITGEIGRFRVAIDGEAVQARRIVLATGVVDELPRVDGVHEHYGESLFHCPSCDGYEARDRDIVALGWSEHICGFSLTLLDWAASVTLVTDGHRFEGDHRQREVLAANGITVIEQGATALIGTRGDLRAVRLADGSDVRAQLAFFSIAHHVRNQLAVALGCETSDEGCVLVDEHGGTNIPGVFAAGDLVPGYQLVQVAAAEGATAAIGCAESLRTIVDPDDLDEV